MNNHNSTLHAVLSQKSSRNNKKRQEFWNGTLIDDYNFLMSEELICHCKSSLGEPFTSLNDLAVHHVSYNEFEKQYVELSEWCERISTVIQQSSYNALTCYLRQKYYEELYEQGLMRLRMFNQYSNKLIERFPDIQVVIEKKIKIIYQIWNDLEARFIGYLDEDFDRIIQDLHNELFLFEEWITEIEEQLAKFHFIRNEKIFYEDIQELMKLQNEIKSKNSRVSSVIEICHRLKKDYQEQNEQIPIEYASDLENRWHQIWINSVEIQCKLEERFKSPNHSTSLSLTDEDDIIPFNSSEYEKISLTSSNTSSIENINTSLNSRKRPRSPDINPNICSISLEVNSIMAKSYQPSSVNVLPTLSPPTFYYSLTNINDYDDNIVRKKQKKTSSKLDIGYASEDDIDKKSSFLTKKSQSDYTVNLKSSTNILSTQAHSLPSLEHTHLVPDWWTNSATSAYDTCSNPDIDLSIEKKKKTKIKPSLLMYDKKYTRIEPKSPLTSNSYDASAEYTDPEQSENDVDVLSSLSPIHYCQNSESLFYNRYATTTTGYSSEFETTTLPSDIENQQLPYLVGEVNQMNTDKSALSSAIVSNESESNNKVTISDKLEASEPCWDGYQNPLFYPLNSQDIDSVETTLKWDDQFFEMDQSYNSTTDDEIHIHDNFGHLRNNNGSSSSLSIARLSNKQQFDSDSDLDDFNYVINETERQLNKARQSFEKKKRRQQLTLQSNDRNQRKFDEIRRTCETNIQCLQQILTNLHRSKNSRLNNIQAIELLETYLSEWYAMRQQVNDDRPCARHLLHISQEIIKLRLHIDEQLSHINTSFNPSWFENNSFDELKQRIYYEIELDKENRQKLDSLYTDLQQIEEHLKEYRLIYPDGPSSFTINEQLHSSHITLEQVTAKMDSYQIQLRTLSTMINNLIPIEYHIEQKLTTVDYTTEVHELQALVDNYARMIPMNEFYEIVKHHCDYKLDIYRKMLNDLIRKQEKHVSFDGSINFNNNNSTNINSCTSSTSSSSSASSTPQEQYTNENNIRNKKTILNKYRQKETRDIQQNYTTSDLSEKQSTTSSYISDDCKVLYIETVIEVAKPVFYERTIDTLSTKNTEYHHHHIPRTITSNRNKYLMDITNNNHQADSTDDDLPTPKPVNLSASTIIRRQLNKNHLKQQGDSGIEFDQTSSSSTLCNQRTTKDRTPLFPPANTDLDELSQSSLLHHIKKQNTLENEQHLRNNHHLSTSSIHINQSNTCWDRLKQTWFRSILTGLLILMILFFIYLSGLDTCSRSTIIQTVCQKIISIESEGIPTI
ncbi:unnamed protein product [Adineta steineri]|uniref:KASH domain-containing protein n=1 Tax=Adineta steineri TaxID=433720 RepID=A0A814VKX7_9BILA|nr:unnamed protein product [Adineta steineri]CAF3499058.1 unnamed protein product [Adineta steineri]